MSENLISNLWYFAYFSQILLKKFVEKNRKEKEKNFLKNNTLLTKKRLLLDITAKTKHAIIIVF